MKSLWFYDEMKNRKQDGEVFDFRKISYQQLMELYWIQGWSDRLIADIYDCSVAAVVRKRKSWDITFKNIPIRFSDRPKFSHQTERVGELFHKEEYPHKAI